MPAYAPVFFPVGVDDFLGEGVEIGSFFRFYLDDGVVEVFGVRGDVRKNHPGRHSADCKRETG
jgi:hypothetical protein